MSSDKHFSGSVVLDRATTLAGRMTPLVPDQDCTTLCPGNTSVGSVLRKHSELLIPGLSYAPELMASGIQAVHDGDRVRTLHSNPDTLEIMTFARRPDRKIAAACSATRCQRVIYAVVALILTAFGISSLADDLFVGTVGLLLAVMTAAMAITGFCPPDWLTHRENTTTPPTEVLGYPYASGVITLD